MYDAMHIGTLKKLHDVKHLTEHVNGIVKTDEETVKDEKKIELILSNWKENIVIVISMIITIKVQEVKHMI